LLILVGERYDEFCFAFELLFSLARPEIFGPAVERSTFPFWRSIF